MRKSLRRDVLTRDRYTCQHPLCQGSDNELTIHHIIPVLWLQYWKPGEDPNVSNNLVTLCSQCHQGIFASIEEVYSTVIHDDQAIYYHLFGTIILPEHIWKEIRTRRHKKTEKNKKWWRMDFDDHFQQAIRCNSERLSDMLYESHYSITSCNVITSPVLLSAHY